MDEVYVSLGDVVVPGQPIALLSGSGRALGERPESFNAFVYLLQDPADKQGETFVLSSTLRGAVDRLEVRPGAVASFAQPIAVIRGSSEGIRLQALVPSHSVTEVAVGSEVYLKFDAVQASDMEAIKTRVRSISRAPLGPAELAATFGAATSPEPMFLVDLDSGVLSEHPVRKLIRPGVGFRMTVPAERKSLLRWLTGYKDEKA
ncbi:TPA: HlyD family efflux transporter periplasmic adaptor subunit [Stenotrophomonas maltophilia]